MAKAITYRGAGSIEAIAVGLDFAPGETLDVTDDEAATLLTSPLFADSSGKNPNFTCVTCGTERFATGTFRAGGIKLLRTPDKRPLCAPCFDAATHTIPEPVPTQVAATPEAVFIAQTAAAEPPHAAPAPQET